MSSTITGTFLLEIERDTDTLKALDSAIAYWIFGNDYQTTTTDALTVNRDTLADLPDMIARHLTIRIQKEDYNVTHDLYPMSSEIGRQLLIVAFRSLSWDQIGCYLARKWRDRLSLIVTQQSNADFLAELGIDCPLYEG